MTPTPRPTGFRFHPPAVEATPELRWVLLRAFGPPAAPAPEGVDVELAAGTAAALGLGARIGARARRAPELVALPAVKGELARASAAAAVEQLRGREAAGEIAAAAAEEGIPCCFLKGVALEASGVLLPGGRPLGDVDVLAAEESAPRLADALARRGFRPGAGEPYPHHLAPLHHPRLGLVEVHRHLPGVSLPGERRFATFADLAAAGLLRPWRELAGKAWVPAPPALAAHALAHALAQHGFRPFAYPQLRLLADLVDLGVAGDRGAELLGAALPLVARWVPAAEVQAAADACRLLASGQVRLEGDELAALLLRHMLAGALDERYREALKLQDLAQPLHAGGRLGGWWSAARQAVALSPAQVDRIYGKQRGPWGYLARLLFRPLDLLRRWLRARRARRDTRPPRAVGL